MIKIAKKVFWMLILSLLAIPFLIQAQNINVDASKLLAHVEISLSPRSGSFEEGSTFQVPIFINTKNRSINGIEVRINFDKDKLLIVNPTGGVSIIGVWVEPPKYDNTHGTASYVGVVPNGITTEAGLVGTVTFKAISPGDAVVSIASSSKILLSDGLGTAAQVDLGRASYTILPKAPEGVQIFSDTHPVQSDWYNNNTPVLTWTKDPGVAGFSFVLDNKPNTIPDNTINTVETMKSFEALPDGLWYFHIKASKGRIWGTTGHFLMHIDTAPPAQFKPESNFLAANAILSDRTLVSFFTTDNLSGIDHYEVGIIDKNQPATESPVFVEAQSLFQVPLVPNGKLQVIVRAVDKAGNVRDASIDVSPPVGIAKFFQDYLIYILLMVVFLGLIISVLHLLTGRHVIRNFHRAMQVLKTAKDIRIRKNP
jgi:hypothetical protein